MLTREGSENIYDFTQYIPAAFVLIILKFNPMPVKPDKQNTNSILHLLKTLLNKFIQSPDIYPIKYYKKTKRFHSF